MHDSPRVIKLQPRSKACNISYLCVLIYSSKLLLTFWYINHKKIKGKEWIHVTSIIMNIVILGYELRSSLKTLLNTIFNNNSVLAWWSVLLVEVVPEKTPDLPQISDNPCCLKYTSPWTGIKLTIYKCK